MHVFHSPENRPVSGVMCAARLRPGKSSNDCHIEPGPAPAPIHFNFMRIGATWRSSGGVLLRFQDNVKLLLCGRKDVCSGRLRASRTKVGGGEFRAHKWWMPHSRGERERGGGTSAAPQKAC